MRCSRGTTDMRQQGKSHDEMQVIVAGAGLAGIEVAKALQGGPADVTVVDRNNYTLLQPLLYQVTSAALSLWLTYSHSARPITDRPSRFAERKPAAPRA